ncbi:MAG: methyl-accepting chemotaxis protein [Candidatus Tectimicrobiota bacterium]
MHNLSIRMRLALGFGTMGVLMLLIITLSLNALYVLEQTTETLVSRDWKKAELSNEVIDIVNDNARAGFEFFLVTDKAQVSTLQERRTKNRQRINELLEKLQGFVSFPEEKALLENMQATRKVYAASFDKTIQTLLDEKRDEAVRLMQTETLPASRAYISAIDALIKQQGIYLEATEAEARHGYDQKRVILLGLGAVALLVGIGCACWVSRSITRPMATALQAAEAIAQGDLSHDITVTTGDETGRLLQAMQSMRAQLQRIVEDIRLASSNVSTAAHEIVQGNGDLSQRTQEQASALEETASSMEQMTSTVKQNADNARQANQLAADARSQAEQGGLVVSQAVTAMADITQSSTKIADITSVIDSIAFQTNLLALNAAVEAARAGDQGRGFAVVAAEVRKLAQRSAEAAREIKTLIGESVDKVEGGSRLVGETGKALTDIVTAVKKVSDIVAEIAAASQEQSAGIEQVNKAVMQMDQMTQQNAALVEEAAAASESVQGQAQSLEQLVAFFTVEGRAAAASLSPAGLPVALASTPEPAGRSMMSLQELSLETRAASPSVQAERLRVRAGERQDTRLHQRNGTHRMAEATDTDNDWVEF